MALQRFTLKHNKRSGSWELKNQIGDVIKASSTKAALTRGGMLSRSIGRKGGTVRIHLQDGKFEEERTFPRGMDPRRSPG
jgi:hypothetical protein